MSESREVEIRQWHGMLEEELRQVIQPSRGERRVADYVAWLLTELERVRAERDEAQELEERNFQMFRSAQAEVESLRAERDAARAERDEMAAEEPYAQAIKFRRERDAAEAAYLYRIKELAGLQGEVSRLQEALRELTARYGRPAAESGGPFL